MRVVLLIKLLHQNQIAVFVYLCKQQSDNSGRNKAGRGLIEEQLIGYRQMAKSRDAQETRIVNGRELNLKKLSRTELLELLLEQTKELEATQARVSELEKALADRKIEMEQAGNIAEAALQLNKVFEAAQQAADDYVLSVTGKHITELPKKNDGFVKSEEAPEEGEEKTEEAPEEKPEESQEEEEDGGFWDTEVPEEELEEPLPDPDAAEQSPEQMEIEYEDLRADKAQERP
jgi:hypothetical protein